jgi:uncharacterized integral membrane protein (TIGR00698 family)
VYPYASLPTRAIPGLTMPATAFFHRLLPDQQRIAQLAPGVALCVGVVLAALAAAPVLKWLFSAIGLGFSLPAIVLALVFGIALHRFSELPRMRAGVAWCAKPLLRFAVGLLGLRIALGDIAGLGLGTGLTVVLAMAATIVLAMWLARRLGCSDGYGALSGAANAVCGASATIATSTVLPDYKGKEADVVFTVIMANAISTIVMLAYPPLCHLLGFTPHQTGVMLGVTVHDMAQVVGAGYAVSEPVGDTAVVVKMFRVFLLLPVVVAIGWWFQRQQIERTGSTAAAVPPAAPPVPAFAVAFLALCVLNSMLLAIPFVKPIYLPVKQVLGFVSSWGLLVAIGALGLGTSLAQLLKVDWRQLAVFLSATLLIFVIGTVGVAISG